MTKKTSVFLLSLLLAGITLAVYWPVTHFDFINYDDPDYVIYNPPIQHGVTPAALAWAFHTNHASNWHPLTWISHALDFSIWGLQPGGHHLTNLLFHAANTVLLFLVLYQLTGALWRAALVAALFAWHPLHVESVAWISERKDVLSTFFWLLTMAAYGRYAKEIVLKDPRRKIYYALALVFFALGLLSKPMVVTLPFVLLLLDFWPLQRMAGFGLLHENERTRLGWVRLVLEKVPFLALAALDSLATFAAQKRTHAVVSAIILPVPERIANALVSYVLYLWKMLWPVDLALPYPYSHHWSFADAAAAALLLMGISLVAIFRSRRQPFLLAGWLWFLGALVPVIGLVQVGMQFMADRYSYVPLIGIFIMVSWAIPGAWAQWPRPGFIFASVIACALLFLLAGAETQLQYWRNSVTLFSHTVAVTRDNILAEYNLGEALARQGDPEHAIEHYQLALAITPNPVEAQYNSQTQAHYNLGLIWRSQKKWAAAESQFRAVLSAEPTLAPAHANLGTILAAEGHDAEALQEFRAAAHIDPREPADSNVLTMFESACAESGRYEEAIATAEKLRTAALEKGEADLAKTIEKRVESYRAAISLSSILSPKP